MWQSVLVCANHKWNEWMVIDRAGMSRVSIRWRVPMKGLNSFSIQIYYFHASKLWWASRFAWIGEFDYYAVQHNFRWSIFLSDFWIFTVVEFFEGVRRIIFLGEKLYSKVVLSSKFVISTFEYIFFRIFFPFFTFRIFPHSEYSKIHWKHFHRMKTNECCVFFWFEFGAS